MSTILQSARAICHTLLQHEKGNITPESLATAIEKASAINIIEGQTLDKKELFEILMADFSIGKGDITVMSDKIEPWLSEEKVNILFNLWNRYKLYMQDNDPSFPVNDLDDFTDKILDKCVNPKINQSWDRRGMVVGHVQSGKTSNYVGLINKAVDSGYKVVIVIAGTISSLRRQTQERIDEGFIGRNSSAFINDGENKITGVGVPKYNDSKKPVADIYSLTSSYYKKNDEGDFSQNIAKRLNIPIGKNPIVFVIKKNKSILENLIDWFSKDVNINIIDGQPKLFNVPALIIDDEADAASVNASKSIEEIKTINKLIRTLLNLFNQNTFIGYTATPYANLFIPQDYNEEKTTIIKRKTYRIGEDLFPRDFIINIKAPANYIGAAKIFGMENPITGYSHEPLNVFRQISDYDPPFFKIINSTKPLPDYLPESLETAIKSFILTCTIRRLRGHETKHNSMLIHVALLVRWIDRVAYLVNDKMREYKNAILSHDKQFLNELKELYENDFLPTTENVLENLDYKDIRIKTHTWDEVLAELSKGGSKIEVRSVHGTRSISNLEYHKIEEIDYSLYKDNGLSIIAVGGSRLSRGITLEGLSISYYLRTTKMYDSLMQMGRWFGYRPGYVDLCRLYTTDEIFEWFNHITMATEEMRNDFDEMTAALQKPKDFKLKVRNHHGLLTITSIAKLAFSETKEISFSGSNPQTYQLLKTKTSIDNNFRIYKELINKIGFPSKENIRLTNSGKIRYLFYPNQDIEPICEFLDDFQIELPSIINATLSEYIRKQSLANEIEEWSICIVSNSDEKVFINRFENNPDDSRIPKDDVFTYELSHFGETIKIGCSVRNQPMDRRSSEFYLISKNQIDTKTDRQVDLEIENETNSKIKQQRAKEKKGLLLIYSLDERGTPNVNYGVPIIGYSLYFPKIDNEVKVTYQVTLKGDFDKSPMENDDNNEND